MKLVAPQRPKLRARALEVKDLKKVSGGRGSACGEQIHCNYCGASCDTVEWGLMSDRCPVCTTEM